MELKITYSDLYGPSVDIVDKYCEDGWQLKNVTLDKRKPGDSFIVFFTQYTKEDNVENNEMEK